MKSKLLLLLGLFFTLTSLAQTDGWYLYTKVSEITKIVPDDSNSDELHLATDIGYIKYNTSTNSVTEFLNLTSQDPAIGSVKDIVLDPTSNDIAFTLIDGIGIYDGNTVVTYRYDNSDLTIGETTSQFLSLQLEYAKDGSLYIFKEDVLGYQILNTGVFEPETVTPFRPQDIIENDAGTKAFFASDTDGLWELEKATDTWTNYTTSNSDLVSNFVLSLYVDTNDLLYVGGFQGLNTLSSSDVWNTYQELDPINSFPFQVHDISVNENTGELVVNNSAPSTYFFGLSVVDLDTNTWTNYREDGTSCLDNNSYSATAFGGDGKVYAAPVIFSSIPDIGKLVKFTPSTETCTNANINYLNAPIAINANVVTDFSLRKRTNGNIDLGLTRTFDFHSTEIDPTTLNGTFPTATTITPLPGEFIGTVSSDNNKFIVDTNTGWLVLDESNTITELNHNLPDYLSIVTKKATLSDAENGIVTLVHKGFDADFNYRVYKTQCDLQSATCSASEEIFTNDRDFTQDVNFGCAEDITDDKVIAVGVKTNSSGEVRRTKESWIKSLNSVPLTIWDEGHPLYPLIDLVVIAAAAFDDESSGYVNDENTMQIRTEDSNSQPIITDINLDLDNDNMPDEFVGTTSVELTEDDVTDIVYCLLVSVGDRTQLRVNQYRGLNTEEERLMTFSSNENSDILNARFNTPSRDFFVRKFEIIQYSPTEASMVMLTNYGMLVKSEIDISTLLLSTNEVSSNNEDIYLYPNPASDIVTFSDDSVVKIEVYNLQGKKILAPNTNHFSVKNLSSGLYIVKATNLNGVVLTKKLIKH